MGTLTRTESTRMYSWWWDSHISPKHSKWLQENLTDMDAKVRAMIKLIEEDADSFARRAEMFYKKRPELMKLIEELYRAYRALAERYDHTTGELRKAHRTMIQVIPNYIPSTVPDELPSIPTEPGSQTPETPHPIKALLVHDELGKDTALSSLLDGLEKSGICNNDVKWGAWQKGLKQLNEMLIEADAVKKLNHMEDVRKRSEIKVPDISEFDIHSSGERKWKLQSVWESKVTEDEISVAQPSLESYRVGKLSAGAQLPKVSVRSEAGEHDLPRFMEVSDCVAHQRNDFQLPVDSASKSNEPISEVAAKLEAAQQKCILLEEQNHSLQEEISSLVEIKQMQAKELAEKNEELSRFKCSMEKQPFQMKSEAILPSVASFTAPLGVQEIKYRQDFSNGDQSQEEMEVIFHGIGSKLQNNEEANLNLGKPDVVCSINDLQDEVSNLRKLKVMLEDEVAFSLDERRTFLDVLNYLEKKMLSMDVMQPYVHAEAASVGFNAETSENSRLNDVLTNVEEKVLLLTKLKDIEKLLEENLFLENSLSDANVELEGLRENIKKLNESLHSVEGQKSTLLSEKDSLIVHVATVADNMEKHSETITLLENSLADAAIELDGFRIKSKSLEDSCHSLQDENSSLLQEKYNLVSEVQNITRNFEELEKKYVGLEDQNSYLEEERHLVLGQVGELEALLNQEKQNYNMSMSSSNLQLTHLQSQVHLLQGEIDKMGAESILLQEKILCVHVENCVLQSFLNDLKEMNDMLRDENQRHVQGSIDSEKLLSELDQEMCIQMEKRNLATMHDRLMKEINLARQFLPSASDNTTSECKDVLQITVTVIKHLLQLLLVMEDEVCCLFLEVSISTSLLRELSSALSQLRKEKDVLELDEGTTRLELSKFLNENDALLCKLKCLTKDMAIASDREQNLRNEVDALEEELIEQKNVYQMLKLQNFELLEENQFWKNNYNDMRDETQALEERYSTVFKDMLSFDILSTAYENFLLEKFVHFRHLYAVHTHGKNELNTEREKLHCIIKENLHLMESNKMLHKSHNHLEDELCGMKCLNEQLIHEIESMKFLCDRKETELREAYERCEVKDAQNREIHQEVLVLKEAIDKSNIVMEDLEKKIVMVTDEKIHPFEDLQVLSERNKILDRDLSKLFIKLTKHKFIDESLHTFSIISMLIEEKICELVGSYRKEREERSKIEILSNDLEKEVISVREKNTILHEDNIMLHEKNELLEEELVRLLKRVQELDNLGDSLGYQLQEATEEATTWKREVADIYENFHDCSSLVVVFEQKLCEIIAEYEGKQEESSKAFNLIKSLEQNVVSLYDEKSHQYEELLLLQKLNGELQRDLEENQKYIQELKNQEEHLAFKLHQMTEEAEKWEVEVAEIYGNFLYCSSYAFLAKCKYDELFRYYQGNNDNLQCQLHAYDKQVEIQEIAAATIYNDLYLYVVCTAILEEKFSELIGELLKKVAMLQQNFENMNNTKNKAILESKIRVDALKTKNEEVRGKMLTAWSLILSLKESLSLLEMWLLCPMTDNIQDMQFKEVVSQSLQDIDVAEAVDFDIFEVPVLRELRTLQAKVECIKEALMDRSLVARSKPGADENGLVIDVKPGDLSSALPHKTWSSRDVSTQTDDADTTSSRYVGHLLFEPESYDIGMKDILLDQVSGSCYDEVDSCKRASAEVVETYDAKILELWENAEQISTSVPSIDLPNFQSDANSYLECPHTEDMGERNVVDTKFQVDDVGAKKFEGPTAGVQKVTDLQKAVMKLKYKVENIEPQITESELENLKMQLKELEEDVLLMTNKEGLEQQATVDVAVKLDVLRELESILGNLQPSLLRFEENLHRKNCRPMERSRVILRDFLYGRRVHRKNRHFCACVRPHTQEE